MKLQTKVDEKSGKLLMLASRPSVVVAPSPPHLILLLPEIGCAFFCGGIVHQKVQRFNKAAALVNSRLLLMAVMGLLFPAVLHFTHTVIHQGKLEVALSWFSSCIMLIAYRSYLFFQLNSQNNLYFPFCYLSCRSAVNGSSTASETSYVPYDSFLTAQPSTEYGGLSVQTIGGTKFRYCVVR